MVAWDAVPESRLTPRQQRHATVDRALRRRFRRRFGPGWFSAVERVERKREREAFGS